jgi:PAS domain S-box-containing protein
MKLLRDKFLTERWQLAILAVMIVFSLIAGGIIYYKSEKKALIAARYAEFKAIADLKTLQIMKWREDRIEDAEVSQTYIFSNAIVDIASGIMDNEQRSNLKRRLFQYTLQHQYDNAIIAMPDGKILLSADTTLKKADKTTIVSIGLAASLRETYFSDIYYNESKTKILLDVIAPVIRGGSIKAFFILQIDPKKYLFQLVQKWPIQSKTAETLIVEKDGDYILFVNELLHKHNSALKLRIPLSDTMVAGVKAVLGKRGICEGIDYKGKEVIAELRPLRGTPWFMVTKEDRSELFSEINYRAGFIIAFVLLLILLAVAGLSFFYNYRQKTIYKELFDLEKDLRATEDDYQSLFERMLNGFAYCLMIYDGDEPVDFIYIKVNDAFETLTGLRNVTGKKVSKVIPGIRQADPELFEIYGRVALTGKPEKFEMFVSALNDWYLITVYSPKKEYFVAVFDVITERKKSEQELIKISTEMQLIFKNMINAFVVWESVFDEKGQFVSMRFGQFNDAYSRISQLKYEDVKGKDVFEVWPTTEPGWVEAYGEVAVTGIPSTFDMYHEPTKGWYHCNAYRPTESPLQVCVIFEDITEIRKAGEILKESEEKFRNLFENSPVGKSMTEVDGTLHVNNAFCNLTGYSEKELLGKKWMEITHPEDILLTSEAMQSLKDGKQTVARFEKRFIHKKGHIVWTDISSYLQKDANGIPRFYITSITDITERKQAMEKIELQYALLTSLINSPSDIIIFSLDTEYRYTSFNVKHRKEMKEVWNADVEIGMNILDLIGDRQRLKAKQSIDRALGGESFTEMQHQPDTPIYFELNWNPIRQDNEIKGATVFMSDISERWRVQEEIKKLNENLEQLVLQRTAELNETIDQLEEQSRIFVGRELKMIELTEQIAEMELRLKGNNMEGKEQIQEDLG